MSNVQARGGYRPDTGKIASSGVSFSQPEIVKRQHISVLVTDQLMVKSQ